MDLSTHPKTVFSTTNQVYICDVPSKNKYSNLFTGKNTGKNPGSSPGLTGIYREVYQDSPGCSPGCTGKFPGIWLSLLWIHWEIPRKLEIYQDIAMSSPVFHRWMTGEFSIPWEIFVLVFAWNVTYDELFFSTCIGYLELVASYILSIKHISSLFVEVYK